MVFYDIESGEKITLEQLRSEYIANRKQSPKEYNYPFSDYIKNSLTTYNGTLEIIK